MVAHPSLLFRASGSCLDANLAALFVTGALGEGEAHAVEAHVDRCASCRRHLSELVSSYASYADAQTSLGAHAVGHFERSSLTPGTRVGRYVLERPLGAGAMGIVWAAHDRDLGRRVALKMLRGDVSTDEEHQNRLLKEARAMARLAHPNVVTVYDLVIVERQLVLALELIDGESLTAWLGAEKRTWRQILDAFGMAGRGLAAAHAVGLVHRDFKPDNVLRDRDGRIAVTDFGLARLTAPGPGAIGERWRSPTGTAPMPPVDAGVASLALTSTGALIGTPRYMAPEQIQGQTADARSDQFSFGVALYEALYGHHPFGPTTRGAAGLFDAVCAGRIEPSPRGSEVPSWIRRVLVKALSVAPPARYASVDELLAALSADPGARRRRVLAMVGTVGALAGAAVLLQHRRVESAQPSCSDVDQKLVGVWDDAKRASIERAFLATGVPGAAASFRGVQSALDAYARDFSREAGAACLATRTQKNIEPAELRRMACLDERITGLRALTEVLEHADGELVANAVAASRSLSPVAACHDPKPLDARPNPPDPRTALRVADLRQELAAVTALTETHKLKEAGTRAATLVENATASGYAPIEAEALLARAQILKAVAEVDKMEPLLYRAAWRADAAGDDKTRAVAWLRLLGYLGMNVGSKEGQDLWIVRKQAIAAYDRCRTHDAGRSRADDELEIEYLNALTQDALGPGNYQEARRRMTELASLVEKVYGVGHWRYATALDSLAKMNLLLGDYDAALGHLDRARDMLERDGATETTLYAHVELVTGQNLLQLMRVHQAETHVRRAIDIEERTGRPDNQRLVVPLLNLGTTLAEQGKFEEAEAAYQRSIALLERNLPKTDSRFWEMNIALAETEVSQGKAQFALARLEPILKIDEARRIFPAAEFVTAKALAALQRDPKRARGLAESALERLLHEDGRKGPRYDHRVAEVRAWLDRHARS